MSKPTRGLSPLELANPPMVNNSANTYQIQRSVVFKIGHIHILYYTAKNLVSKIHVIVKRETVLATTHFEGLSPTFAVLILPQDFDVWQLLDKKVWIDDRNVHY